MSEISIASCAEDRLRTGVNDGDAGFVLVAVLGAIALVSAIGLVIATLSKSRVQAAANLLRNSEAQLLADGLTVLIGSQIANGGRSVEQQFDRGSAYDCTYRGYSISYLVQNLGGLVDVNAAPRELLAQLLRGLGVAETRADELAAAIVDFRDADRERLLGGGLELDDYKKAGSRFGPKNAPFDSTRELDQVVGMSPEIFGGLLEFTTVGTRKPDLDNTAASSELLQVLERGGRELKPHRAGFRGPAFGARYPRRARIIVHVRSRAGTSFARDASMELAPQVPIGFRFTEWSRAKPTPRILSGDGRSALELCLRLP